MSVATYRIVFYNYSYLTQLLLFFLFMVGAKDILKNVLKSSINVQKLLYINILWLTSLALYSLLIQGNEPSLVMRFYFIINLMIAAFFFPVSKKILHIFILIIAIHALYIIGFEYNMMAHYNASNYGEVRFYINSIGIGDVYTYDEVFWRIQLAGNHLLPLALFISIVTYRNKKRLFLIAIFLMASIFSGHFAFLIAIFFFFTFYYIINSRKSYKNIIKFLLSFFMIGIFFGSSIADYVSHTIERKSNSPISTRMDQTNILMNDLSEKNIFLGSGLGNTIEEVTLNRDYRGMIYYELQSLYFLNQVGFIYFIYFIFLNIFLFILKMKDKNIYLIYLSFLLYALTNPYTFDSVHIVIIIVLLSLKKNLQTEGFNDKQ